MSHQPITVERMEAAMEFLAESDDVYAQEKMELERAEICRKRVRARIFQTADGTVAERQAIAETSPDTIAEDDRYIACVKAFETVRAKRQRAELLIDVFRTLEASRRKA